MTHISFPKLSVLLLVFFLSINSFGQSLPRNFFNGSSFKSADVETLKKVIPAKKAGLEVVEIIPQSTAEAVKIQKGDILLTLNGESIDVVADFKKGKLSTLKAGDKVQYEVWRNNKKVSLEGIALQRPPEKGEGLTYEYGAVKYQDGLIRSLISKPEKATTKLPAVLFIQGYTCSPNVDLDASHPYKRLTDGLSKGGYVVMRIEKPGMGESKGTPPCGEIDFVQETEAFENALLLLKQRSDVDSNQIYIWGHSMGGLIAPVLAARHSWVSGCIVYGTVASIWSEYLLRMNRSQAAGFGLSPVLIEQNQRLVQKAIHEVFVLQKAPTTVAQQEPTLKSVLQSSLGWNEKDNTLFTRSVAFNHTLEQLSVAEKWSQVSGRVLAIYGEADIEAIDESGAKAVADIVNYYHPGNGRFYLLPQTDHSFAKVGSIKDGFRTKALPDYGNIMVANFNPEIIRVSLEWLKNKESKIGLTTTNTVEQTGSWTRLITETYPGKQDDICFVDEKEGWYVNGYGRIYHTNDGGQSWEKQWEQKGSFFRCIAFIDSLRGFAGTVGTDYFPNVSDTIPLYETKDGGKTWTAVKYTGPYVKGLCALDIVKEQYINHGKIDYKYHIYGVGRVGSPANMIVSKDGGETWHSQRMDQHCKMLFDIKMLDKKTGFACAATSENIAQSNALILKTTDGGNSWKKVYQSNRPFETTWKASFPTPDTGYVTIQSYNPDPNVKQQRIAKTVDGGETWQELNLVSDAAAREFGIGFTDALHGFAGTVSQGYETKDGGKTWTPVDIGRAANKIRFYTNEAGKTFGYSIGVNVYRWE